MVIAPTTLVTALMFWFGYTFTTARTFYLGIPASVLDLSVTDYLVRSAEALIVPVGVLLAIALGATGIHAFVDFIAQTGGGQSGLRTGGLVLCILGSVVLLLGVRSMFEVPPGLHYLVPPVLLGGGAACAGYGFYTVRKIGRLSNESGARTPTPAWEKAGYFIVSLLVVLGLFWATTLYAGALGHGRGMDLEKNLQTSPSAIIYSKQSLALAPPVLETRINSPDSEFRFKYSELRLVIRAANKYFLFPEGWSRATGTVIILEDSPSIRIEFRPGQ